MSNVGNCKICKKEIIFKSRGSRSYVKDFCSNRCYDLSTRKTKFINSCLVCEAPIYLWESSKSKYCSDKCALVPRKQKKQLKNKSRIKICKTCQGAFKDLGKNNQKEFCNRDCLNMGQKAISYKLDPNDYFLMKQQKCCPICNNSFDTKARIACLDHCHNSGKVRALICRMCNTTLGQANDSIDTLKSLIKYLESYK